MANLIPQGRVEYRGFEIVEGYNDSWQVPYFVVEFQGNELDICDSPEEAVFVIESEYFGREVA